MAPARTVLLVAEFGRYGGTRSFFEGLVGIYAANAFRVIVAVTAAQVDDRLEQMLREVGGRIVLLPGRDGWMGRAAWRRLPASLFFDAAVLWRLIRRARPDLIVVSAGLPTSFLGALLLPARVLYIVHTVPTEASRTRLERVPTMLLGRTKRILAVSKHARERVIELLTGPGRSEFVSVLHNGVSPAVHAAAATGSGSRGARLRVLTVGHVAWYKNPRGWLEVARRVTRSRERADVEFVWVGEGEMFRECRAEVEAEGADQIRFVGFRRDVAPCYASSTIYFQPSLMESHGMAVVDAMWWSLPCVVSDAGGLPESVVDGGTGYVVPAGDLDAMADRILALLDDEVLRRDLGRAGRTRCENEFSHEVWTKKMLDLHESILS